MEIKFKILGVSKQQFAVSMSILYYSDEYPEGLIYTVDVPVNLDTGEVADANAIRDKIMELAPIGQLEQALKMKNISASLDIAHIESLVEPTPAESIAARANVNQPISSGTQVI